MKNWPSLRLIAAHLTALSALALVHPLLQLIAQNPEFFVAHGISGPEMVLIVVLLLTVPPCIALLLAAMFRGLSFP
jgi:hypothetical protein